MNKAESDAWVLAKRGTYSLWIVYEGVTLIIAIADVNEILHPVFFLLLCATTLQTESKAEATKMF